MQRRIHPTLRVPFFDEDVPTVRDVAHDPRWLPHTFDLAGQQLTSVFVPRASRSELMFLSDEHFADRFGKATFPASAIAAELKSADRAPIHFIFHTSFCCSTLLARALDIPGVSAALREPDIFINLGNRLIRSDDPANRQRIELVLRMLERPSGAGESVVVKPSNFGNRLVDVILAQRPGSRAVLLYSDVGTFLRSLLRRGMFGRIFGRKLFNQLTSWSSLDLGYAPSEIIEQTDVQVAALAWLMQIAQFDAIARAFGPERVMVIDSTSLLEDPPSVLREVQALFGLGLDNDTIARITRGTAFSKHSKFSDREYDVGARERDQDAVAQAHADELEMVVQWIDAVAARIDAPLRPGIV